MVTRKTLSNKLSSQYSKLFEMGDEFPLQLTDSHFQIHLYNVGTHFKY